MGKIDLESSQVSLLENIFYINRGLIKNALSMTKASELDCKSLASTLREAMIEYYTVEEYSIKQRASVRKIIELSSSEEDAIMAFYLSTHDLERKLAIRKMAEVLFLN